jgi:glutathione-regulated potassium-efflux system ancillary protein KefG
MPVFISSPSKRYSGIGFDVYTWWELRMARLLILFAHPALEKSRIHRQLIRNVPQLPGITFHDLYEAYPTFNINVQHEQALLAAHDIIVWQHPFFWYSTPALLKQWEDLVLEHGWAYGANGTALHGKYLLSIITAGGGASAYQHQGYNRFTIRELLTPLDQTATLCKMIYLPPLLFHGTHRMSDDDLEQAVALYYHVLTLLHDDKLDLEMLLQFQTLNDALEHKRREVPA